MYKVMIVDDERPSRNILKNILKNIIEKENLGVEVAGEASGSIEAINTIDVIKPDIVFVDIRMPFMDGIEFSKIAIKRYPDLKIIIISAFSDFEYARECIRIGVCEYLLKPINSKEIRKTLLKVIENLNSKKQKNESSHIEEYQLVHKNDTVSKIKKYIEENYVQPDLNVASIAETFGFNASYLSRLFKAETDINLIDYINECRMKKAIEYAKKGTLMYITAKSVGIPDPNYFGKCFKKYTNKNYSEFKKYKDAK
ncbi:response regulator [Acetivibrio saccincola]|jgi:YesN/AraC family two-component response regulator|uniref:Stage 0 sporulation protein A homolog n=1 Tax=Acetivibrio saccincola TaxID=1677857 RepID=A0A2S8R7K2_9FIRM|nr:response regulator [Acetivibrio saccincola]PQQ65771.1 DNA-binding response regulator [Acetivibrio saccincola]HOA96235.1 response regulator [Acetivibrio saccincola]HQD27802.1 response regulator [Acetivibrio saccincola]